MKKISVIIPVYNSEKYIEKCLNSIFEQKYENLEVIVINDGSTDKTEEKISKFQSKIKYIKKEENTGIADTRNIGVENATGDYIMFVDSDDYIQKDLLKNLALYIERDIELIKFKAIEVKTSVETKLNGVTFDVTTGPDAFSKMCFEDKLIDILWIYLYKKELLKANKFTKGLYHEDFGLVPLIILQAKTVIATDIYGYYYVQSDNSITRNSDYKKTKKKLYDLLEHYDRISNAITKYNIPKKNKQDVLIFCTNSILLRINQLKKEDQKEYIKEIKKRKMTKNIKVRNLKQLIKRIVLEINIPLYLKIR
ncbi:MAG: glycosyltransferase [Clostridia bacterium]|nr:glycosyltransferase [Clostridia bacterium]